MSTENESVNLINGNKNGGRSIFVTISGLLGNVFEWYDFAVFSFFSDIFAEVFFPPENSQTTNLVLSLLVFAAAFLVRPLGAIVIGNLGDKYGRKLALTVSLFLMGFPTFATGLLPSYAMVGDLAPILLLLCRLLQGFSVGGQLPASLVYTVENHPKENWGLIASTAVVAANSGTLLGNTVGACFRSIFTREQLVDYAWRIPFLVGILVAFFGWFLRKYGDESNPNTGVFDREDSEYKNPLCLAFSSKHRLAVISATLVCFLTAAGFDMTYIWMPVYMADLLHFKNAFWVNECALIVLLIFVPLAGLLSDKIGRSTTLILGNVTVSFWGLVVVLLLSLTDNPFIPFVMDTFLSILFSLICAPVWAWMFENFDPEIRLTSSSLAYQIAFGTVGGFSPAIATLMYEDVGEQSPGLIYLFAGTLAGVGLFLMHCHKQRYSVDKEALVYNGTEIIRSVQLPLVDAN